MSSAVSTSNRTFNNKPKRPPQPPLPDGPSAAIQARHRPPTGKPSWTRLLISGGTGARKSWVAAEFATDDRIDGMYWLEVGAGEDTADEYGMIPGANYQIIVHDGTYRDIYEQICAHWDLAKKAEAAGQTIALTVDAMSGINNMLSNMSDTRARRKLAHQLRDAKQNPDLAWSSERDVTITPDLHTLVRKRHEQLMAKILTWPGPVILITRERIATVFEGGEPTKVKEWSVECRKDLPSQCTSWIRLHQDKPPTLLKLRSGRQGVLGEAQRQEERKDFTVAKLIFEWVGCQAGVSRAPESRTWDADQPMAGENPVAERLRAEVIAAASFAEIQELWQRASVADMADVPVLNADGRSTVTLGDLIYLLGSKAKAAETEAASPAEPASAVTPPVTAPVAPATAPVAATPSPVTPADEVMASRANPEQVTAIQARLTKLGHGRVVDQIRAVAALVGRQVGILGRLTAAEAVSVLAVLDKPDADAIIGAALTTGI